MIDHEYRFYSPSTTDENPLLSKSFMYTLHKSVACRVGERQSAVRGIEGGALPGALEGCGTGHSGHPAADRDSDGA